MSDFSDRPVVGVTTGGRLAFAAVWFVLGAVAGAVPTYLLVAVVDFAVRPPRGFPRRGDDELSALEKMLMRGVSFEEAVVIIGCGSLLFGIGATILGARVLKTK